MKVTNLIAGVRMSTQWSHDERMIIVTDDRGNEYVIQPARDGGIQVMTFNGSQLLVAPKTANAVELRGDP
jgi:hypothetical protein